LNKEQISWWEYEHYFDKVEYTIIGGGIVGISTAISLKQLRPRAKILVIDKKKLPFGASTKNAGFACFGSISEIYEDYSVLGADICAKLIQMRWNGLSILRSRVAPADMNYRAAGGAEIFENQEERSFYSEKIDWVNQFVADIVKKDRCFVERNGVFGYEIVNTLEGALNPQLMMHTLERQARDLGVRFLTGIEVSSIDMKNDLLYTDIGQIPYTQLIVCTNGFSHILLPEKDIKPARNQVMMTEPIPNFKLDRCYHMNKGFVYFRSYQDRLLIGGGRDLDLAGETTSEFGTTEKIMNYLKRIVSEKILPGVEYKVANRWSGILGVGKSKMPILEKNGDNVVVAVRMGGMGVAIGSYIGEVAARMLLDFDNSGLGINVN